MTTDVRSKDDGYSEERTIAIFTIAIITQKTQDPDADKNQQGGRYSFNQPPC